MDNFENDKPIDQLTLVDIKSDIKELDEKVDKVTGEIITIKTMMEMHMKYDRDDCFEDRISTLEKHKEFKVGEKVTKDKYAIKVAGLISLLITVVANAIFQIVDIKFPWFPK